MIRRNLVALGIAVAGLAALPAGASAGEEILGKANYDDATTFQCRTNAIPINPGQNLNLFAGTQTCPNAVEVGNGPSDASVFGTNTQGYITRFKPSMVEITDEGDVTPSVYDLHLHHVVWVGNGGPTFASGEEKTEVKLPQGYGFQTAANAGWALNYMIHSLNASSGRRGLHHLGDRLGAGREHLGCIDRASDDRVARRRRRPSALSGLRCRAGLR